MKKSWQIWSPPSPWMGGKVTKRYLHLSTLSAWRISWVWGAAYHKTGARGIGGCGRFMLVNEIGQGQFYSLLLV